ncbi:MAG: DUF1508 domain-containing protein [Oceanicaulis sp.]
MSVRPQGLSYPCFWIYKDNSSQWRWVYYAAGNGEEIAVSSESYIAKRDCERAIEIMKGQAPQATIYEPRGS